MDNCPKCKIKLLSGMKNGKIPYKWCNSCHGLWISLVSIADLIKVKDVTKEIYLKGLNYKRKSNWDCPDCGKKLVTGRVFDEKLVIEECEICKAVFFDNKEFNKFYDISKNYSQKNEETILKKRFEGLEFKETDKKCPICSNVFLKEVRKKDRSFFACSSCGGTLTTIKDLQHIAGKSLFNNRMFHFREGQHEEAICKHCGAAQSSREKSCLKCGKELRKLNCPSCEATMSEYILKDIIIDRCNFCSTVWLESGELDRAINALPDIKREYERSKRNQELITAVTSAKIHTHPGGAGISKELFYLYIVSRCAFYFFN